MASHRQVFRIENFLIQFSDENSGVEGKIKTRIVETEDEAARILDMIESNPSYKLTKAVRRNCEIVETPIARWKP